MLVKLKKNYKEYLSGLSKNKIYRVLILEGDSLRIINNFLEPILYPSSAFEIIDNSIDEIWKVNLLDEKYYKEDYFEERNSIDIGPEIFYKTRYFFQHWFDNKKEEREIFDEFLIKHPEYLPNSDIKKWFYIRQRELIKSLKYTEDNYNDIFNSIKKEYRDLKTFRNTKFYNPEYHYCKITFEEATEELDNGINDLKQQLADLNKFLDENPQYKL